MNNVFKKKKVDSIIQSLIDKITSIPYTVRCISKLISLLISKKFPLLPTYSINAFIGKFILNIGDLRDYKDIENDESLDSILIAVYYFCILAQNDSMMINIAQQIRKNQSFQRLQARQWVQIRLQARQWVQIRLQSVKF